VEFIILWYALLPIIIKDNVTYFRAIGCFNEADTHESSSILIYSRQKAKYYYTKGLGLMPNYVIISNAIFLCIVQL